MHRYIRYILCAVLMIGLFGGALTLKHIYIQEPSVIERARISEYAGKAAVCATLAGIYITRAKHYNGEGWPNESRNSALIAANYLKVAELLEDRNISHRVKDQLIATMSIGLPGR